MSGLTKVQCAYFPDEWCTTCGPDGDAYVTGPAVRADPAPHKPKLDSPIERWFWEAHARLQLPELDSLVTQHPIEVNGHRYRVDFALVERRIAFELDGYVWHSGRAAWAKDRRRDLVLALLGWRTYRFDGSLVRSDAEGVVRIAAEIVKQAAL